MTTTTRRIGVLGLTVLLAVVALALWLAPFGRSIIINYKTAPLGLVGMTEGQTLRISVAYVTGFAPQPDPPGCRLQAGFVGRDGSVIGDPTLFELRPGVSRSFDFVASGDGSVRHYARPVVVDLDPKSNCPAVVGSEVLDREGISGIIINYTPVDSGVFVFAK